MTMKNYITAVNTVNKFTFYSPGKQQQEDNSKNQTLPGEAKLAGQ
jgi:hypothetical protein